MLVLVSFPSSQLNSFYSPVYQPKDPFTASWGGSTDMALKELKELKDSDCSLLAG